MTIGIKKKLMKKRIIPTSSLNMPTKNGTKKMLTTINSPFRRDKNLFIVCPPHDSTIQLSFSDYNMSMILRHFLVILNFLLFECISMFKSMI